jgi:hypothetical protein
MTKSRTQELSQKAQEEQRRCRDWLLRFMERNQPKFLTKAELRGAAMRELNVSKNSFDFAWIDAIEEAGRRDWYEPLRRRLRIKTAAQRLRVGKNHLAFMTNSSRRSDQILRCQRTFRSLMRVAVAGSFWSSRHVG